MAQPPGACTAVAESVADGAVRVLGGESLDSIERHLGKARSAILTRYQHIGSRTEKLCRQAVFTCPHVHWPLLSGMANPDWKER